MKLKTYKLSCVGPVVARSTTDRDIPGSNSTLT